MALDHAVWTVCGWDESQPDAMSDDETLGRLLALNQNRAGERVASGDR
jgi:hypothetical protein